MKLTQGVFGFYFQRARQPRSESRLWMLLVLRGQRSEETSQLGRC